MRRLVRYERIVQNFSLDVRDFFWPPPLQQLGPVPSTEGPREVLGLWGKGRCLGLFTSNNPFQINDDPIVWETIWKNRDDIEQIVHTHPLGPNGFSSTDYLSMGGIVMGLGKTIEFWLISPSRVFSQQVGFHQGTIQMGLGLDLPHKRVSKSPLLLQDKYLFGPPQWVPLMKRMSNMTGFTDLTFDLDPEDF